MKCKYPKRAINKVLQKLEDTRMENRRDQSTRTNQIGKKCHIVGHTHRAYVKVTKQPVANMVSRYILREGIL